MEPESKSVVEYDQNQLLKECQERQAMINRIKADVSSQYDNITAPVPFIIQLNQPA